MVVPLPKATMFGQTLPAAEGDWLAEDIMAWYQAGYLRIYVCISVAGVLRVARMIEGVTITENLNAGMNLVAGSAYMFTVAFRAGDKINMRYSATGGTIKRLTIDEIGGAE